MKTTHSFGIDFLIRRCKENKKRALIYARISVDLERKEISIKEQIDVADWDSQREQVKGKSIGVKTINDHIDEVRSKIKAKYRMLVERDALITAETVKQAYLGEHLSQKGHKMKELLDYYVKIWKGKLKEGGFKNYETTIAYIELFMQKYHTSGDMYLSQLDMQAATDFEHYVRNYPIKAHDPCLGNGVAKHVQRFKRLLNWAVEIQWISVNPCEKYSCPQKKSKRKKLTIEELVAMEEKQFLDPSINYVKILFLYSCYTGLAFADAMALKASDFEWDTHGTLWCKIYRTKSDGLCPVPLLKSAANILHKFLLQAGDDSNRCLFPMITNQHANKCLKIIKETCGIITPMTYHVARHTFAKTVALKNGVPLETVQMMLGHTKISTTQIYADVDEEKIMGDMNGIEDKLDKKRRNVLANVNTQMIGINANDGRFTSKSA